jgi:hypothetical protein
MGEIENFDLMDKFHPVEMENSMTDMLQLLFDVENVEAKTEMDNPYAMAGLKSFSKGLADVELSKTSLTLSEHLTTIHINMISHLRKSRGEFVDAFKAVNQQMVPELTMSEKLTTNMKDK